MLATRKFVAGDQLTIGDIPIGIAAYRWFTIPVERDRHPNVEAWYGRLTERPAFKKYVMTPCCEGSCVGRHESRRRVLEKEMESRTPNIIDLNAELAKLTMFQRTPQSTAAERKGSVAQLATYRDGLLLAIKASGKDHWERHLAGDELIHILDGTATLEMVCDDGPPKSFALRAGMMAVIPQGAWHRFLSPEGNTHLGATPFPGESIEFDVDDPRTAKPALAGKKGTAPSIVDLNAELGKLMMFRGRTPRSTMADRQGSAARLAPYRDGGLSITKFAGKGHWEAHLAGDELIHILDGSATLGMVCDDGPPKSFALTAGMLAVNPQGAWHRFQSAEGVTLMAATPVPSEVIELDVEDPRTVKPNPV